MNTNGVDQHEIACEGKARARVDHERHTTSHCFLSPEREVKKKTVTMVKKRKEIKTEWTEVASGLYLSSLYLHLCILIYIPHRYISRARPELYIYFIHMSRKVEAYKVIICIYFFFVGIICIYWQRLTR